MHHYLWLLEKQWFDEGYPLSCYGLESTGYKRIKEETFKVWTRHSKEEEREKLKILQIGLQCNGW